MAAVLINGNYTNGCGNNAKKNGQKDFSSHAERRQIWLARHVSGSK